MVKLYRLPEEPKIEGVREFKTKDIAAVTKLLQEHLYRIDSVIRVINYKLGPNTKFTFVSLKKMLSIGLSPERMSSTVMSLKRIRKSLISSLSTACLLLS